MVIKYNARVFLEGLFATPEAGPAVALAPTEIGVENLDPQWRIEFEERAAILEFDGGLPREYAEAEALKEILKRMRTLENTHKQ